MFRFAKAAVNVTAQGARQVAVRQCHHGTGGNFHDKYGNVILLSGAVFCGSVWAFVLTQTGIVWNCSPIGKVTPKPWRE